MTACAGIVRLLSVATVVVAGCPSGPASPADGAVPGAEVTLAATCARPSACGGDPIGTWRYVGGCVAHGPAPVPSCPSAVASGSGSFFDERTFVIGASDCENDLDLRLVLRLDVPASCAGAGCGSLAFGVPDVSCGAAGDGSCPCSTSGGFGTAHGGSCEIAGSTLTFGEEIYELCVDGDTLTLTRDATYPDLAVAVLERIP